MNNDGSPNDTLDLGKLPVFTLKNLDWVEVVSGWALGGNSVRLTGASC